MATEPSLALFWTYVTGGRVNEEIVQCSAIGDDYADAFESSRGVKTLTFEGYANTPHECAKWGPSFSFPVLVEREEYVRCWECICSKPYKFITLRGTEGIGKSVFVYWLIYKIVKVARDRSGEIMPTFLLINASGQRKVYEFLSIVNGSAVVQRLSSRVSSDYVLSDIEHDIDAVAGSWNLHVGFEREPKIFTSKVEDAKELGLKLVMQPCLVKEVRAMLGPASTDTATFSYIVFGGSARMAHLLTWSSCYGDEAVYTEVETELTDFLVGTVYATKHAGLIQQAARVIAEKIEYLVRKSWEADAVQANAVRDSIFVHTYIAKSNVEGSGTLSTCFASAFMAHLAGVLIKHERFRALKQLRNVLTSGGPPEVQD